MARYQYITPTEPSQHLMIKYDEVRQMYCQNLEFGFFFLELVAERLMRDATQNKHRVPVAQAPTDLAVAREAP